MVGYPYRDRSRRRCRMTMAAGYDIPESADPLISILSSSGSSNIIRPRLTHSIVLLLSCCLLSSSGSSHVVLVPTELLRRGRRRRRVNPVNRGRNHLQTLSLSTAFPSKEHLKGRQPVSQATSGTFDAGDSVVVAEASTTSSITMLNVANKDLCCNYI